MIFLRIPFIVLGQRIARGSERYSLRSNRLGKDGNSDVLWILGASDRLLDLIEGERVLD